MKMKAEHIDIRNFTIDDYDAALALWRQTEGMGLSLVDEREPMRSFLAREPGLSFVAHDRSRRGCESPDGLVATLLGGTDGRRGFLYHLAVDRAYRGLGIGGELVERCLAAMRPLNIEKCHLFVIADNEDGKAFWEKNGWTLRRDIHTYSKKL